MPFPACPTIGRVLPASMTSEVSVPRDAGFPSRQTTDSVVDDASREATPPTFAAPRSACWGADRGASSESPVEQAGPSAPPVPVRDSDPTEGAQPPPLTPDKEHALRMEATSLKHCLTHKPKNPFCEICTSTRSRQVYHRKGALHRETKAWGEIVTADHSDCRRYEMIGINDEREALVIRDVYFWDDTRIPSGFEQYGVNHRGYPTLSGVIRC